MGATSVDHLDAISDEEIDLLAKSDSIGIITPTVNFQFRKLRICACAKVDRCRMRDRAFDGLQSRIGSMSVAADGDGDRMPVSEMLPAEAMNAVTINAAHAIGIGDRVGSIEVGKSADFVICDSTDYRQLAYEFGGNLVAGFSKRARCHATLKTFFL
jgi:imidazolonepropionase